MVRRIAAISALLCLMDLAGAQSQSSLNEGAKLTKDSTANTYTFSWWGRAGRTYFIQHSEDLHIWEYLPVIEPGAGQTIEWGFTSSAARFFLRLRYSDIPTSDPFAADFDGDGVGNYAELLQGTDPLDSVDTDGDGLPDWWELLHGTNPNSNDSDGDGVSDSQEFVLHRDPLIKDNPLVKLQVSITVQ